MAGTAIMAMVHMVGDELKIETPYNGAFVAEIRAIDGRRWDARSKAWFVPATQAERVGTLVRRFFPVPGAGDQVEYEIVVLDVTTSSSRRRTYCGGVTIDGVDVISRGSGHPISKTGAFETLAVAGPGYSNGDANHAFTVNYRLTLKVRKGATIDSYGSAQNSGAVEIIERRPA